MRTYVFLTLTAVLLVCAAGGLYLQKRASFLGRQNTLEAISDVKTQFFSEHEPLERIDLYDIPQMRVSNVLIMPEATLPHTFDYPTKDISALYGYAKECKLKDRPIQVGYSLRKAFLFQDFLCGKIKSLPDRFFERSPYLHPSGRSFVKMAFDEKPDVYPMNKENLKSFAEFAHFSELKILKAHGLELNRAQNILISLKPFELRQILQGAPLFLTEKLLFVKGQNQFFGDDKLSYLLYPAEAWLGHFRKVPFTAFAKKQTDYCLLSEGNICWNYNRARMLRTVRYYAAVLIAAVFVLTLTLVLLLVQWRKGKRREEENRLFILQTLTHELRTPATTLQLCLERFRKNYDALPSPVQTGFLRMCDEVQRLHRIIENSTLYLRSNDSERLMELNEVTLPSANGFFKDLLHPYREKIQFNPLTQDEECKLDPYWVGICIKNLVENAIHYGVAPVSVQLEKNGRKLRIRVCDQGKLAVQTIEALIQNRAKSKQSNGLGLGLSLVSKIVNAMKGKLNFDSVPTTFTIELRSPA